MSEPDLSWLDDDDDDEPQKARKSSSGSSQDNVKYAISAVLIVLTVILLTVVNAGVGVQWLMALPFIAGVILAYRTWTQARA